MTSLLTNFAGAPPGMLGSLWLLLVVLLPVVVFIIFVMSFIPKFRSFRKMVIILALVWALIFFVL